MKKKLLSLALALTMVLAMAIPVFAGSYSSDGYYEGSYYEIAETCSRNSFSCSTICMDYSTITYVKAYDSEGNYDDAQGSACIGMSTASDSVPFEISRIHTTHYVNNNSVRTNTITP